jgi:hypothetical protein
MREIKKSKPLIEIARTVHDRRCGTKMNVAKGQKMVKRSHVLRAE